MRRARVVDFFPSSRSSPRYASISARVTSADSETPRFPRNSAKKRRSRPYAAHVFSAIDRSNRSDAMKSSMSVESIGATAAQ